MRPPVTAAAVSPLRGKLVGLGSAGIDFLAQVSSYPAADEKIRTEALEVRDMSLNETKNITFSEQNYNKFFLIFFLNI